MLMLVCLMTLCAPAALAGIDDDRFDGNIFALYAGNGSLIPPRVSLAESRQREKATVLMFYVDDSRDCKRYASVISQVDAFYGRAADIVPINVDAIPPKSSYGPTEPGYYYEGYVPQTIVLDQSGKVVLNTKGNTPYEQIDDVLREVFDLLPRTESVELKRRSFNEFSGELAE